MSIRGRRSGRDSSGHEILGHAKDEEMQRLAAHGERNVRHGAGSRRRAPRWELYLAWLLIAGTLALAAWLAFSALTT